MDLHLRGRRRRQSGPLRLRLQVRRQQGHDELCGRRLLHLHPEGDHRQQGESQPEDDVHRQLHRWICGLRVLQRRPHLPDDSDSGQDWHQII